MTDNQTSARLDVVGGENCKISLETTVSEIQRDIEFASLIASIQQNPLAGLESMHRNLRRALGVAKGGWVDLTEGEVRHWIAAIEKLMEELRGKL